MLNFAPQIISSISTLIGKIIPDKDAAQKLQLEVLNMQHTQDMAKLNADLNTTLQQLAINKVEAEGDSLFKAGVRPAAGWVCVAGLAYQVLIRPLVMGISGAFSHPIILPDINTDTMMVILFGLLGLGAYRSFDKASTNKSSKTTIPTPF